MTTPSGQSAAPQGTQASRDIVVWLSRIHARLGIRDTCFALANETRVWSGWDRVSVAVDDGTGLQLESISGLETFDPRAGAVRELETALRAWRKHPVPYEFPASTVLPDWMTAYVERVKPVQFAIVPLQTDAEESVPQRLIGAFAFEVFEERPASRPASDLQILARHAAVALDHALVHAQAAGPWGGRLRRFLYRRRHTRSALVLGLIAFVLAVLILVPADLVVTGTGQLEPLQQRDLFAHEPGIVSELWVTHDQQVHESDPLIRLRSPELDFESQRLRGELETVKQQIGDLETLRSDPRGDSDQTRSANELAARAEELKTLRTSLEHQLQIVEQRLEQLTIRSPLAGHVLTWEPQALLAGRPVNRTDRLLTVADLEGPWVLKLKVDPRDLGPVADAVRQHQARLTFVTADAPTHSQSAQIREIAPAVEADPDLGQSLSLTADVERSTLGPVRPGTHVMFRMTCGRGSLGYVHFRRLIDRINSWWALQ